MPGPLIFHFIFQQRNNSVDKLSKCVLISNTLKFFFFFLLRNLNASSFVSLVTFFFISVYFTFYLATTLCQKYCTYTLIHTIWNILLEKRRMRELMDSIQPPSNIYNTLSLQRDLWGIAGLLRFNLSATHHLPFSQ